MNIAHYTYWRPNGHVTASTNSNVPRNDRFIAVGEGLFTREENTWDNSVTWYDPSGAVRSHDRLPWVVEQEIAAKAQAKANAESRGRAAAAQAKTDDTALRSAGGLQIAGFIARFRFAGPWGNDVTVAITKPDGVVVQSEPNTIVAAAKDWADQPESAAAQVYGRLAAALCVSVIPGEGRPR